MVVSLWGVMVRIFFIISQPVRNPEASSFPCREGTKASCIGREDLHCSVDVALVKVDSPLYLLVQE